MSDAINKKLKFMQLKAKIAELEEEREQNSQELTKLERNRTEVLSEILTQNRARANSDQVKALQNLEIEIARLKKNINTASEAILRLHIEKIDYIDTPSLVVAGKTAANAVKLSCLFKSSQDQPEASDKLDSDKSTVLSRVWTSIKSSVSHIISGMKQLMSRIKDRMSYAYVSSPTPKVASWDKHYIAPRCVSWCEAIWGTNPEAKVSPREL